MHQLREASALNIFEGTVLNGFEVREECQTQVPKSCPLLLQIFYLGEYYKTL